MLSTFAFKFDLRRYNKEFCESLNPTHIIRVNNGELTMENCYGLSDKDFEHEVVVGDATALAAEAAAEAGEAATFDGNSEVEAPAPAPAGADQAVDGRGVHSSISQLNVSAFC